MNPTIEPGDHVVDAIDDFLHGLLSAEDEQYVRQHVEECRICSLAMEKGRDRLEALRAVPAAEVPPGLVDATVKRVREHAGAETGRTHRNRRWTLRGVVAALTLVAMLHVYLANHQGSGYDLRVLGQRELVAGTRASLRTQFVRHGRPVAGAAMTLSLADPRSQRAVELASYRTDASGTGSPRIALPDWPDGSYTLTTVARVGLHTEQLTETIGLKRASRLMLTADKPVYQPGQTIHMRALALRQPDFLPVAGQEATFLVTDPAGNIILKHSAVTSPFGLASTDCALAGEIAEGDYTLTCRVGSPASGGGQGSGGNGLEAGRVAGGGSTESQVTVEVRRYALPKMRVEVATDKAFYAPGERVRATVEAAYFFGQPVANARLEAVAADRVQRAAVAGATDAAGKGMLEFVIPDVLAGLPQEQGDARVNLAVTATDTAGQAQTRTVPVIVTMRPIQIEVVSESGNLVRNVPNRIYLLTTYADGRPAATTISIAGHGKVSTNALGVGMLELTPREDRVALTLSATDAAGLTASRQCELAAGDLAGHGLDYLVRTDKAVYRAGETLHLEILGQGSVGSSPGASGPVFVDLLKDGQTMLTGVVAVSKNRGSLAIDLAPELAGTLQVRTYRFDADGFPVRKTRLVYVQAPGELKIDARLDRAEYRPGESARLQFRLTDREGKPKVGALSLAAVDEAVFSVLPAGGGGGRGTARSGAGMEKAFFTLDEQWLQPVYTLYPGVDLASPEAAQGERDRGLLMEALFSRAVQTTASREQVIRRLIDRGDLSPRALRYLDTEWGRRALQERLEMSDLPDSQKALLLQTDGVALEARTGPGNEARAQSVQRARRGIMPLLWIATIIACGLTLLLVYAPQRLVAVLVVLVIIGLLIAIMLPSLGKARELSNRSVAAAEAAGLVQALQVANEDGEVFGTAGGPAAGPRLRQYFPETLLWRPELITDAQGTATLDVPLADSITTWRLTSSAVTAGGELGALEMPIRVFQPFFIELDLPPALTRQDEVTVPVVVYNYLPTPQTVRVVVRPADWHELLPDAAGAGGERGGERTITLAPRGVASVKIRMRALKAGTHTLQVSAARAAGQSVVGEAEAADALQRTVLVVPDGQRQEVVTNETVAAGAPAEVTITLPPEVIEQSAYAAIKLYPSTFSQLVEGLDSIFQMPHGCFEQTSSTTYPNVLALDYLQRTKTSSPAVEAKARQYIHLGYQRLLTFEVNGSGGFDWYGRGPANVGLTAYGLMQFQDMARVHAVDGRLLERTRKWLLSQQRADGSWPGDGRTHGGQHLVLASTAYVAWAVFSEHPGDAAATRAQAYLREHATSARGDAYVAALAANALLAIDRTDAVARDLLASLAESCRYSPDRKQGHWPVTGRTAFHGYGRSGEVETTALAVMAMLRAGTHPDAARAGLTWLVSVKDGQGTWHSTQATVLAFKALLAGTGRTLGDSKERRFTLSTADGRLIEEIRLATDQDDVLKTVDLTGHLRAGTTRFRLASTTKGELPFQWVVRYHTPRRGGIVAAGTLAIAVTYDRGTMTLAETLGAQATLKNTAAAALPMILLDLPIPPGFAAERSSLESLVKAGMIDRYEVTPRQMVMYLRGIEGSATVMLPYRLRPTMAVKVEAPAASAYEYYHPQNRATSVPVPLEVRQ